MSKHKQLLFLFFHELYNFFRALGMVGYRCLFVSIFANFSRLYWPTTLTRHQVFLLIVCTTGVTILHIFFESDKYWCPLTVSFKFPTPRDKHVPFEAKIFPTPEEFETGPPFSFFNNAPINVKLQPRTKLLRQFHLFSNFCALLPSPLNTKSKPPPHPLFKVALV